MEEKDGEIRKQQGEKGMRRRDREVVDPKEVFDILKRCDTVCLGIQGEEYPYVVPVSFGAERTDGQICLYFHCAREGKKLEMLERCSRVCVEGDIFYKTETTDHGITTRYESVIGFGTCTFLEEEAEIRHALQVLTEHYGYFEYPLASCRALSYVKVGRVVLEQVTGKRNLPVPD